MAVFDLPAMLKYIRSMKDDDVRYIGHSLGTSLIYILASEKPEVLNDVKAVFNLAPVAFFHNIKGLMKLLIPFFRPLKVSIFLFPMISL